MFLNRDGEEDFLCSSGYIKQYYLYLLQFDFLCIELGIATESQCGKTMNAVIILKYERQSK